MNMTVQRISGKAACLAEQIAHQRALSSTTSILARNRVCSFRHDVTRSTTLCANQTSPTTQLSRRAFSATSIRPKKQKAQLYDFGKDKETGEKVTKADPADHEELKKDLAKAIQDLKDECAKLNRDGRLSPEIIEQMRVHTPVDWNMARRSDVKDLATVIPKGRAFEILVDKPTHVRPIASLIAASPYSLVPKINPNGNNPLLITFSVPPATSESRARVHQEAHQLGNTCNRDITAARAKQQKKYRAMRIGHMARPDDIDKYHKVMNGLCDKANEEWKRIVDKVKDSIEGGATR